jgi:peptidoglycan/xylan/chitin deacetylase (PgdA/CDA1 family)
MDTARLRIVVFTAGPLVAVNRVFFDRLAADARLDLCGIVVDEHQRPRRPLAVRVMRGIRREGLAWLWFKIATACQAQIRRTAMRLFERWHPPHELDPCWDRWASRTGVPVYRVADINAAESVALIESLRPGLGVIVGGRILEGAVIAIPTHGTLNIHKRRVPEYRGGGPVGYWEILAGESSIGVTIHTATTEVDAGRVLAETTIPIEPCDTLASLAIKADIAGASLYHDAIGQFAEGARTGTAQDETRARTYRAPSDLAVARLERRLQRRAAGLMPTLKTRDPWIVRMRVLVQYLLLLPWLLRRRQAFVAAGQAPIGIFFYHVIGNRPINHMCLPLEAFVSQVEFLRRYYDVLSLDEAVSRVRSGRSDRLASAITFDDGYRENAWAIAYLRYYGVPATFFVSMGHIGDGTPFEHDRRRGFDEAHPMRQPDVARLASDGFLVGSHGLYHEDMGALDPASADRVLRESRERVAAVCGRAPDYFSFPKGQRSVNITADTYALAINHYRGVFSAYGGHNFPSEGRQHFVRVPNRTDLFELAMTMDGYTGFRDCLSGNEWGVRSYTVAPY